MSIKGFIASVCVQTAVYWEPAGNTGYGETWEEPVEISCRWDDAVENITNKAGTQIVSMAKVMVTQDIDERGYLFLGTLDDLDSAEEGNPKLVRNAHQVQKVMRTPLFKKTSDFIYEVYL